MKAINNILGFDIGNIYYYDEKGNLTKEVNSDEGYNFDYSKVYDFCEKKNIKFLIKEDLSLIKIVTINKIIYQNNPCWHIQIPGYVYYLDGSDGSIIAEGALALPKGIRHFDPDV